MASLVNSVTSLKNPLLREAEQGVEKSLTPENRENYLKILVAGMRAGLAGGPNGILAGLKREQDPIQAVANGAVNLVLYLRRLARGTMPEDAMIPAAHGLMLQALDFVDSAGIAKIGKEELGRATQILVNNLFRGFGISPEQLDQFAEQAYGVMQNPEQMAQLQQRRA